MTAWQFVWRNGFAPILSTPALLALKYALEKDDPALIQGATTDPPPIPAIADWPVTAACALAYAGWRGEGLDTLGAVEEFFALACHRADQQLGEPGACRWFLSWYDETPRADMRRLLAEEIDRTLAERRAMPRHPAA
jgi:hypothetical protein